MTRSTTTAREPASEPEAIIAELRSVAIDAADSATCAALLGDVKKVRGWVDAFEVRVSKRLSELQETTGGATVADEHARCAGVRPGWPTPSDCRRPRSVAKSAS